MSQAGDRPIEESDEEFFQPFDDETEREIEELISTDPNETTQTLGADSNDLSLKEEAQHQQRNFRRTRLTARSDTGKDWKCQHALVGLKTSGY